MEAYKKEVRDRLTKQNDERAERELEDEIVKKITETAKTEVPDALIDGQVDRMVQEMRYRLSYQGLRLEDYLKYLGKSMEDYRKEYRPQAENIVKSQLVIEKIIETEKIEATEEDVNARMEEMAKAQGKTVEEIKGDVKDSRLEYLKNEIVIKKLFDMLKNANKIA